MHGEFKVKTQIIHIDKDNIDLQKLKPAAEFLRGGGLVAFPTETVYGLGADALNVNAVKAIYLAKGRPSDNPLIVHVADKSWVQKLVLSIPDKAHILMDKFWPGPLTIIFKRSNIVPDAITGGLDTVAIRMPSHPVALALIKESGVCVAAPSANTSGKPSPTHAQHVIDDLSGKIDAIIDGGNSDVGVESTVIDVTCEPAVILRPGGITLEQLRNTIGQVIIDPAIVKGSVTGVPRAPGMKYRHYSPDARVILVDGELDKVVRKINELVLQYQKEGHRVGILATTQTEHLYPSGEIICAGDRQKPETIAANLFDALREFDKRGVEIVLAETVENSGIGMAVMNRMTKAAGHEIIYAK